MTKIAASGGSPGSPCMAVCVVEPDTGLCRGCRRTIDEIAAWPALGDEGKARILAQLPGRSVNTAHAAANKPSSQ